MRYFKCGAQGHQRKQCPRNRDRAEAEQDKDNKRRLGVIGESRGTSSPRSQQSPSQQSQQSQQSLRQQSQQSHQQSPSQQNQQSPSQRSQQSPSQQNQQSQQSPSQQNQQSQQSQQSPSQQNQQSQQTLSQQSPSQQSSSQRSQQSPSQQNQQSQQSQQSPSQRSQQSPSQRSQQSQQSSSQRSQQSPSQQSPSQRSQQSQQSPSQRSQQSPSQQSPSQRSQQSPSQRSQQSPRQRSQQKEKESRGPAVEDTALRRVYGTVPPQSGPQHQCGVLFLEETVFHMFSDCVRLGSLFHFLQGLLQALGVTFNKDIFIFGFPYSFKTRNSVLMNFILGQAKLAILKSRKNKILEAGLTDVVRLFCILVVSWVMVDFNYFKMVSNLEGFQERWCLGDTLCSVSEEGERLFIF
ncbi:transcription factor SPT20 homolog [Acipenser ruthenus]|uniref:transcription factor SPT20 homolog n=1 Tax=Acipenser ruthenus TaxID=7906 RepID=UPI00274122A7|nr:transcription factor SPT20 homolog [Acipenser ruthenus]